MAAFGRRGMHVTSGRVLVEPIQPSTVSALRALTTAAAETTHDVGAITRARRYAVGALIGGVNTLAGRVHPSFARGGELVPLRDPDAIRGAMAIRRRYDTVPTAAALEQAFTAADDLRSTRPLLHELTVTAPGGDRSLALTVHAEAPANDFMVAGKENSPVAVYVNGQHHSDLFVLSERDTPYTVNLADLPAGNHHVELRDARDLTAGGGTVPRVTGATQQVLDGVDALVARYAPVVETRWTPELAAGAAAEQTHSDVPLLAVSVVEPAKDDLRRLRYYLLSSNEDTSGFPFGTIMRKFGRTTDYELMYEAWVDPAGTLVKDKFQGPLHIRRPFVGEKLGERPVLRVTTRNGLFSSQSYGLTPRWSELPVTRYDHIPTDREVMEHDPWTFAIMGKENLREGRSAPRGTVPATNSIAYDAREHLYFSATDGARKAMEGARALTARLIDDTRVTFPVSKPDFRPAPHGIPPRTTAVPLPPEIPSNTIAALELPHGSVFTLDDDFRVRAIPTIQP